LVQHKKGSEQSQIAENHTYGYITIVAKEKGYTFDKQGKKREKGCIIDSLLAILSDARKIGCIPVIPGSK